MDQKFLFLINREWASPGLDRLMAAMSSTALWMVPLVLAGIATLIWGGFKGRAFLLLAVIAFGISDGIVGRILKREVSRFRPHQTEVGVRMIDLNQPAYTGLFRPVKEKYSSGTNRTGEGRSFPSNHASNTSAVALLAAIFWRKWGWLAFVPALLVAYSRVYVGSHWPSDALAGVCLGFGVALLVLAIAEFVWRKWGPRMLPQVSKQHPSLLSA
jgi:membrane-associated phospholipid phosphatase